MIIKSRLGDSFSLYSRLFNLRLELIEDSNRNFIDKEIPYGSEVNIPGYELKFESSSGRSLQDIADLYQIPVETLFLVNGATEVTEPMFKVPVRIAQTVIRSNCLYSSDIFYRDIEKLCNCFPFIVSETIGNSVLGSDLIELRIGRGDRVIHYNGAFHANEWITSVILMKWINEIVGHLVAGDPLFIERYEKVTLSIVPMVNPDGVDLSIKGVKNNTKCRDEMIKINHGEIDFYGWKANIRGVDLNNQFPAKWEIEKKRKLPKTPAPRDYPGDAPLTEPEAIAMKQLAERRDFDIVFALHTQGKEIYWGYEGYEPPESKRLAERMEEVSHYQAICYVDSHAGYKDWFIQTFRRPGFTIEIGKGINPLPLSLFSQVYEETKGILEVGM